MKKIVNKKENTTKYPCYYCKEPTLFWSAYKIDKETKMPMWECRECNEKQNRSIDNKDLIEKFRPTLEKLSKE